MRSSPKIDYIVVDDMSEHLGKMIDMTDAARRHMALMYGIPVSMMVTHETPKEKKIEYLVIREYC